MLISWYSRMERALGHVELPRDTIRVFERYIPLTERLNELNASVFDARFGKRGRHPLQLGFIFTGECCMIQTDPMRIELVTDRSVDLRAAHADCCTTSEKEEKPRRLHDELACST